MTKLEQHVSFQPAWKSVQLPLKFYNLFSLAPYRTASGQSSGRELEVVSELIHSFETYSLPGKFPPPHPLNMICTNSNNCVPDFAVSTIFNFIFQHFKNRQECDIWHHRAACLLQTNLKVCTASFENFTICFPLCAKQCDIWHHRHWKKKQHQNEPDKVASCWYSNHNWNFSDQNSMADSAKTTPSKWPIFDSFQSLQRLQLTLCSWWAVQIREPATLQHLPYCLHHLTYFV